ncbi:MAG: tetratricopeptide repeat protein [Elusimicrobia bacterium]|nr:tetratricopeptide repeat protein [Elusimicrobiota bacterium]
MKRREERGPRYSAGVLFFFLILSSGVRGADLSHQAKEKLVQEAETLFTGGRFEESRTKWNAALAGGASRAEARRWRPEVGRTYEAEGNYQKALATYQESFDLDPKNVDRLVDLARLYDAVEMDDQAIRYYVEAHGRDRSRRDVSLALARLYKEAGRLAEALELAQGAVHAEPRDYSSQELLAEIEEARGDLAGAAQRRETVLSMHPSGAGFMILGRLWAKQGAFEQADAAFARAEGAGGESFEPLFERAVLAWCQEDPARAQRSTDQIFWPTRLFSRGVLERF